MVADRAARRTARFFRVALFVGVVGAVFAFTVDRERDQAAERAADQAAPAPASEIEHVGPLPGAELGPYVEARRQALAEATGERWAVVSLDGYRSEADARAVVGPLPVGALLVAAKGGTPTVVTGELEAWAAEQRRADEEQRAEIEKLLPTVDDPTFARFYEEELVRLEEAIAKVSATSDVVFAVVVRAPADDLRALAGSPGVRLVDVAPGVEAHPGIELRGLRPEETAKAGQPHTRPV